MIRIALILRIVIPVLVIANINNKADHPAFAITSGVTLLEGALGQGIAGCPIGVEAL